MFNRNYGWAAAGLLMFVAGIWLTAAAVVAATDGAQVWQIGVVLGCDCCRDFCWLCLSTSSSTVGKCLLSLIGVVAHWRLRSSLGFPIFAERAEQRLVCCRS